MILLAKRSDVARLGEGFRCTCKRKETLSPHGRAIRFHNVPEPMDSLYCDTTIHRIKQGVVPDARARE